jgi:CubicO group peptidase (beta-lactamase class C family)
MRTLLAAAVSLAIALPAFGQASYTDHREPPDLPGVGRIPAVIEAFNSGDAAAVDACIREHFAGRFAEIPASQHANVWGGTLAQWGPVAFEAVRVYEPVREDLVVILRAPVIEAWRAIVLPVNDEGRFTGMQMAPARPPSYLEPDEPLSIDEATTSLDALIDRLAERDMFSGTVIITKDGRPILERAVGLASRRFDVPNRMDTKFNLGSMNKMITAVAIAQLVENGALSFDDTVGEHLPDYPNEAVRDTVQIRHLLSHTSGMGNHFTQEFIEASKAMYRDFRDYLPLFVDEELAFEPGTDWAYSNAGFFVLGMLVEAASGQSYYDYVRAHIYEPAGMTGTDAYDMDIPIRNLAIGYTRQAVGDTSRDDGARWGDETNGLRNNYFMHSIKGGPAGGGFSTTPDLIRFAEALQGGALVSPSMLETLTTAKPDLSSPGYGYGFSVENHGHLGPVYGHGGGFPGINGMLDIYPEQGLVVTVLSNLDGGASLVAGRFMEMIEFGR